MKKLLFALVVSALLAPAASAQVRVKGYVKKDGTYVQPHYRSRPDNNPYNNYSTRPNYNPYTGQRGTREPAPSYGTSTPYKPYKAPCYYNCPD